MTAEEAAIQEHTNLEYPNIGLTSVAKHDFVRSAGGTLMTQKLMRDDEGRGGERAVDADRAAGCLLGLAVGDALGTTLEFTKRDAGPAVSGMVGGGHFRLTPGQWTDDTSMALCLAESLIGTGGSLDATDLMRRFGRWYRDGENSVTGRCFDIGNITRAAIERFARTGETAASKLPEPNEAGNGTLMRLAPVAIMSAPDAALAAELAEAQSRTTHRAELAHEACRLFATMLVEAMGGGGKEHVLRPRRVGGELGPVAAGGWRGKRRDEIVSSGYVLATLEAALWCVGTTDSFADAVLLAANLGDDADTVAAVTGQLAGALYGRSGIPAEWLDQLAWRKWIEALASELMQLPARSQVVEDLPADTLRAVDRPAKPQRGAAPRAGAAAASAVAAEPTSPGLDADTLRLLGFVDLASWTRSGDGIAYELDGPQAETNRVRLEERNALYAFVRDEQVLYIGKTARTIRKRFTGYCRPDRGQRTNWRCNGKIRDILDRGGEVRILVFNPISHLRYGAFDLNLAAGLEDALIAEFDPPWNGRERGQPISEEAEREEAEEAVPPAASADGEPEQEPQPEPVEDPPAEPLARFTVKLGQAYYEQGIINPGAEASRLLGAHGEPLLIVFDDGAEPVLSAINRTANRNGTVRAVGRNGRLAAWFQRRFGKGDVVEAEVLGPNRILLRSGPTGTLSTVPESPTTDAAALRSGSTPVRTLEVARRPQSGALPIPPLRIAEVTPASGGCIGITIAPGKQQPDAFSGPHARDLEADLDAVATWGADAVITLVEAAELKLLQIEGLGDAVRERGMEWHHLPIPDYTAPNAAFDRDWPRHSAHLRGLLGSGRKILVHCKGGLGRAGTISARLLVDLGSTPQDAIAAVRAVRPGAIETGDQERWVGRDWKPSAG